MKTNPRQMTMKHQRQDYHLFNEVAYLNRVGATEHDDTSPLMDITTATFSEFLPNDEMVRVKLSYLLHNPTICILEI